MCVPSWPRIRRLAVLLSTLAVGQPALAGHLDFTAPDGVAPDAAAPWHAVVRTPSGIEVHAIRTGWVRIKSAHTELRGWDSLRVPKILLDADFDPWLPIISYLVVHPERTVLVDTGPDPRINDLDHFACDPNNDWFYRRNLRFALTEGDGLGARLAQLGIDGNEVKDVVVTHFHGDHIGGFAAVRRAQVLVGASSWSSHVGAFTCQLPSGFSPRVLGWERGRTAALSTGRDLTPDGRVRVVPLPGHTPGHVGLLVEDGPMRLLIAGDATFDLDQTARAAIAGVSELPDVARATQRAIQAAIDEGAVLLPAHDQTVFERLRAAAR